MSGTVSHLSLWGGQVTFIFVPRQVGVRGNERAYRLADFTVIKEGQIVDRADIVNNVIKICRKETLEKQKITLLRMKETGITIGSP
jgi:hypothetical protein